MDLCLCKSWFETTSNINVNKNVSIKLNSWTKRLNGHVTNIMRVIMLIWPSLYYFMLQGKKICFIMIINVSKSDQLLQKTCYEIIKIIIYILLRVKQSMIILECNNSINLLQHVEYFCSMDVMLHNLRKKIFVLFDLRSIWELND